MTLLFSVFSKNMNKALIQRTLLIFLGLFLLVVGLSHFYYTTQMAIFVPLPKGAVYFVYATGALISSASVFIILNKFVQTSIVVIGVVFAVTALMVQIAIELHNPDEVLQGVALSNLGKLALACLMFLVMILNGRKKQNR